MTLSFIVFYYQMCFVVDIMWTNGFIAAAAVGSVVALVVACCWLSSFVQCIQHMYKYWCNCCHKNKKYYHDVRTLHHTRVIFNSNGDTTTALNRGILPPSYSSVFKQDLLCGSQTHEIDRQYTSVVVHHCGNTDATSAVSNNNVQQHNGAHHIPHNSDNNKTSETPSHHLFVHQQKHFNRLDSMPSVDSDSMSYCPSLYSLDHELYNKRQHYYQLVFTQSPDDDEAEYPEYPEIDSPFINFPRRSNALEQCSTSDGYVKHQTTDNYSRTRMMTHHPDVRESVPHSSISASDSLACFVSPPGADVHQYIKRPTQLGTIVPNKRQCVHVLNNCLFNQCRLALMLDKPPTPTAPNLEPPTNNNYLHV